MIEAIKDDPKLILLMAASVILTTAFMLSLICAVAVHRAMRQMGE